mgnify:CR=1 FL=1
MELQQEKSNAPYQIQAYEPGTLTISNQCYRQSLLIHSGKLLTNWRPTKMSELIASDFEQIIELNPELMLLGTGSTLIIPPATLLAPLYEHKIKVEWMQTRAACHTYTILASEERDVLAALLIE